MIEVVSKDDFSQSLRNKISSPADTADITDFYFEISEKICGICGRNDF